MAPKLVLLASLGGSMGFKRTIMKWTLNARVTGLRPQISMKKATTLYCSITQLDSWWSSHLVGQVKTKTCWDSASHFWDSVTIFGILHSSGNGGSGPHSWVIEITSEKANASVPWAPFISFEKSLLSWGHAHVFKAAWTRSAAILPRGLEVLIPYGWCCWEAGPRFPMFFFIHLFLFSLPVPILFGDKGMHFLPCFSTILCLYYRSLYSHSFTPPLPPANPINSLNC